MEFHFFALRRKLAGYFSNFVGLSIFVTGLIQGFALAPPEVRNNSVIGGLCTIAAQAWLWLDAIVPPVWWFLRLAPYPTLTLPLTPLSFLLSGGGWLGLSFGLLWLGRGLAFDAEKAMRSGQDIVVFGDGNCVNAINARDQKSDWWTKPTGLIVIGVLIIIISKFLGVN